MQSVCGNARYMWKCKVHREMQGTCENARYIWKCNVYVEMQGTRGNVSHGGNFSQGNASCRGYSLIVEKIGPSGNVYH